MERCAATRGVNHMGDHAATSGSRPVNAGVLIAASEFGVGGALWHLRDPIRTITLANDKNVTGGRQRTRTQHGNRQTCAELRRTDRRQLCKPVAGGIAWR
jgi:hypothetical protein